MKITVLLFGVVTDIIDSQNNTIKMDISEKTTLKDFRDLLLVKHPKLTAFPDFTIAVNEAYEKEDFVILNNDVIAIIPPVSGG